MSFISGLLATQNTNSNNLVNEWNEMVLVRNATGKGVALLYGLMGRLDVEDAVNAEFNWFEREPAIQVIYINNGAGYASGATSIAVDNGAAGDVYAALKANMILRVERTGEYINVASDPTAAAITVVRGINGSTAAALNDDDILSIAGVAKEEGATPSRAVYNEPDVITNYIQTFNSTVNLTNLLKGSALREDSEGPLAERRLQALEDISRDIEMSLLIGKKGKRTGSNGAIYSTGGIHDAIVTAGLSSTHILNGLAGTGVALSVFLAWCQQFQQYGSTEAKVAFCGSGAYAAISNYATIGGNGFRITGDENIFGIDITTIRTPFGSINLAQHPLLTQNPYHKNSVFVVDLAHIKQKVFEPMFLETNIQLPGTDGLTEQFRAKLGLKLEFAKAFGYAYNLQKIT